MAWRSITFKHVELGLRYSATCAITDYTFLALQEASAHLGLGTAEIVSKLNTFMNCYTLVIPGKGSFHGEPCFINWTSGNVPRVLFCNGPGGRTCVYDGTLW